MKIRSWMNLLCVLALAFAGAAGATIRDARTVAAGPSNWYAVADPVTGRAFVVNTGGGRGAPGSITVIETDGTTRTLATDMTPGQIAIAPALRKLVVLPGWGSDALVIHADSLQVTKVTIGEGALAVTFLEGLGRAYIAHQTNDPRPPWIDAPHLSGSLTELDLGTLAMRTFPITGMTPRRLVADEGARRVLMTGVQYFRTAEEMPGFVQAFDATTLTFAGAPVRLGRRPTDLQLSPTGAELYLLGHTDFLRPEISVDDPRRNSVRPAVFVLNAATLALVRTIDLPDTMDLDLRGPVLLGNIATDAAGTRVYALDQNNARFSLVDPAAGSSRTIELEGFPRALTFDAVSGNVLVAFPFQGYVGVYSPDGIRLDSVPLSKAARMGIDAVGNIAIAVDPARGTAFVTNPLDSTVSILAKPMADVSSMVVNMTDLWYDPADTGWGVFLDHQGTSLFAAMFLRDASGAPQWFVMSDGRRQGDGTFSGALYRTSGPLASAVANAQAAGTFTFAPASRDSATLSYVIDGATRMAPVTRQVFTADRTCGWSATRSQKAARDANFTSLWYEAAQPGWGVALSHRGDTIFGVLFSYDAQNKASWSAMSSGRRQADGSFAGTLYRISANGVLTVGDMSLAFTNANEGVLKYLADGVPVTRAIGRQVFAPLASDCGP